MCETGIEGSRLESILHTSTQPPLLPVQASSESSDILRFLYQQNELQIGLTVADERGETDGSGTVNFASDVYCLSGLWHKAYGIFFAKKWRGKDKWQYIGYQFQFY